MTHFVSFNLFSLLSFWRGRLIGGAIDPFCLGPMLQIFYFN